MQTLSISKHLLRKNDHPELDKSELCNEEQIMCMICQLQWAVTVGRYDILAHVTSMSRFRLAPQNWTPREIKKAI